MTIADRRKEIELLRPAMAYAYFFNGLTRKAVAKKFKCSEAAVGTSIAMYNRKDVEGIYGNNETVIIIPIKKMKEVLSCLKEIGIPHRLPSKDFVLEESYVSGV